MPEQGLSKKDTDLLSALKFAHLASVQLLGNVETLQKNCGIALSRVAVFFADNALKLAKLHAVFVGHVVLCVDCVSLLHGRPEAPIAHDYGIDNSEGIEGELILAKNSELAGTNDSPFLWLQFPAKQLHERGLTCTVGTGQTISLARRERR